MITLKPNCSKLSFKNMEKTKDNFYLLMYGTPDKEIIDQRIQYYKEILESGEKLDIYFQNDFEYLNKLKACPQYQNGNLPRGIEKIILQVIESYSFWHSIQEIDSDFFLNQKNYIQSLINVSITFMVSCELAKLFGTKEDEFSLYNIWKHDVDKIEQSNITTIEEIKYITDQFARKEDDRDESIKRFLDFRNKSVAHNTNNIGIDWSDFIRTINFIIRAWGIIDKYYCPDSFPRPIQISDQLYVPLQKYFSFQQINAMKEARKNLMNQIFLAASTNIKTKAIDNIKPFGNIEISIETQVD